MEKQNNVLPESNSRIYDVELNTALGKRSGQLMLQLSGGLITGILHIMKADNPIHGQLSENGTCNLAGSIRTRLNIYPFEGKGRILPESIEMLLNCMGDSLPFRGIRKKE